MPSRSEGGTLKNVFSYLIKKKNCTERVDKDGSLQKKWEKLQLNIPEVINAVDGEWRSMSSENLKHFPDEKRFPSTSLPGYKHVVPTFNNS